MTKTTKILEPKWILIFIFFVAGLFLGGIVIYVWYGSQLPAITRVRSMHTYKYINPLLGIDINPGQFSSSDKILQSKIETILNKYQNNKSILSSAIYFRNINSGNWVGINEDDKFSPGKLLKIPIMIVYFKLAETNSEILEKEVEIKANEIYKDEQALIPHKPILSGETHTIDELITKMIVYNDNSAANALFDNIDKKTLNEIFSDLGIDFREDKETPDYISLKLYSLFFRILYNATYLNREYSEKALELLVASPNNIGFGAGLPNDLQIANLTGDRIFTDNANVKNYELYDCGIMYYDDNPYDLCGAVKGKNLNAAENLLKEIGITVYDNIKFRYRK